MDNGQLLTAILGLIFVLGLALVTITILKWLQTKGADFCLCKKLQSSRHINIIEQRRLDARNTLAIVEADGIRYFLLIGADSSLVLNQTARKEKSK
ncbi:MAG: hypothetical protein IKK52_06310 [Alphaproteobacteria bacterium]|nr:hypothetical protein [Alphaproteobacteria bacterium]